MIETGRDITKAIIKLNLTEADFAKKCGVTRASIYNWTKQGKLSLFHKRIVESVIREEEGYFIDKNNVLKQMGIIDNNIESTDKFLKKLNTKTREFTNELIKKYKKD